MSKSLKQLQTPNQIIVFADQNTESSALAAFLQNKTGVQCCVHPVIEWRNSWHSDSCNLLLLFDFNTIKKQLLDGLLYKIYYEKLPVTCAMFNVPTSTNNQMVNQWIKRPAMNGIFFKDCLPTLLCRGVTKILSGQLWMPRRLLLQFLKEHKKPVKDRRSSNEDRAKYDQLTVREKQLLSDVAKGSSNTEIACYRNISENTVKAHIYNLFRKIGVTRRAQATYWAHQNKLLNSSH